MNGQHGGLSLRVEWRDGALCRFVKNPGRVF